VTLPLAVRGLTAGTVLSFARALLALILTHTSIATIYVTDVLTRPPKTA
jgi:hypothetical protein